MPRSVRVTSASSQLLQFLRRPYLPSRPFFTLQWALGSSKVWLQPPDSLTTTYVFARHRQVPHLEMPPRSRASCSLPLEALSSPFPTKSTLTLTALLQAAGPVLQEVRLSASVWFPMLPCALCSRLPPPGLDPRSTPRFLRPASSKRSTCTVPEYPQSGWRTVTCACKFFPSLLRAPSGWRDRTLFRDCDVTRLQVFHVGAPNRVFRCPACHLRTPEVTFRGGLPELPRSPFLLAIPLTILQLFSGFCIRSAAGT